MSWEPSRPALALPDELSDETVAALLELLHDLARELGLEPERFAGWPATVSAWRARLGVTPVLPALRGHAAGHLHVLPSPLGLKPPRRGGGESHQPGQHCTGPDPPGGPR